MYFSGEKSKGQEDLTKFSNYLKTYKKHDPKADGKKKKDVNLNNIAMQVKLTKKLEISLYSLNHTEIKFYR